MRARHIVISFGLLAITFGARTASAQGSVCKDGTTSAASGKGACSSHGGVDAKATAAANKAKVAQVTCTDGTMSKGGQGACSGHGGIKKAVATKPAATAPSLPAAVPANSPARTNSEAKSKAPSATSTARADDDDPKGAIAQCKDGKYSHAATRRGACTKHGGVAKVLKP